MSLMHLNQTFVIAIFGSLTVALPLKAEPHVRTTLSADLVVPKTTLNAIHRLEPDFFDQGREQFEQEIERLTLRQLELELPTLTIDESVRFDAEALEVFERKPGSSDKTLL